MYVEAIPSGITLMEAFVGITTVTGNKNFLCLENVVWASNYMKKKRSSIEELPPVEKKRKKEIELTFKEVFLCERGEKLLSALQK